MANFAEAQLATQEKFWEQTIGPQTFNRLLQLAANWAMGPNFPGLYCQGPICQGKRKGAQFS